MATPRIGETAYYALRPRRPVRAWVLAILLLLIGALMLTLGWRADPRNTVLVVIGVVAGVLGLAMAIVAASFVQARTLHVTLTPDGFEVNGPGYHKAGSWIDVDTVSATPDGARLVIARGQVDRTFIQAPGGTPGDLMRELTADISARLHALDVD